MNLKTFLIGSAIILVAGIIFCLPVNAIEIFIPSLSISGILGGIYAGIKRKRPLMNCAYDGFVTSMPASILLGLLLIPLLWIYHDYQNQGVDFVPFFIMVFGGAFLLTGVAGGVTGGLGVGLYYRYLHKDRGELELYETYIEERTNGRKKKEKAEKKDPRLDFENKF